VKIANHLKESMNEAAKNALGVSRHGFNSLAPPSGERVGVRGFLLGK
jgi:hypothetical protein